MKIITEFMHSMKAGDWLRINKKLYKVVEPVTNSTFCLIRIYWYHKIIIKLRVWWYNKIIIKLRLMLGEKLNKRDLKKKV